MFRENKRYNSYSSYFKEMFGERVQKVTLNAGFTCPNRDGTISTGGCTFCDNNAFNPSYCESHKSITQQLQEGINFHQKRYSRATQYLAYFQAYTNTYDSVEELEKKYSEALAFPGITGLVIGTRPDCMDDDKLAFFKNIARQHYLIIEYGIESCYDKTLTRVNRGHTFEQARKMIEKTANAGIKTGAHMIFGLPGESIEEMLKEAVILSSLPLDNIKFHQLQIIKGTHIEKEFSLKPEDFVTFDFEPYIEFVIDFIEQLNPRFVIERIAGEAPPRFLARKDFWNLRNDQIMKYFEKRLEERDSWQGKKFSN